MHSYSRTKLEFIKTNIDTLDINEHIQIYNIMKKTDIPITKTLNGVLISSDSLDNDTLDEVERYVLFCMEQGKRMADDMKTRKTYELMVR